MDIDELTKKIATVNSSIQVSVINEDIEKNQRLIEQISRHNAKRNATLIAGAEANIAQKELFEQQIEIIQKQNALLFDNYSKLKELYDVQVQTTNSAKKELKRSNRFNIAMMIISIVAMIAAVAGPITTIIVS